MTVADEELRAALLDEVVPMMRNPVQFRITAMGESLVGAVRAAGWAPPSERATPRSELRKMAFGDGLCPICGSQPSGRE